MIMPKQEPKAVNVNRFGDGELGILKALIRTTPERRASRAADIVDMPRAEIHDRAFLEMRGSSPRHHSHFPSSPRLHTGVRDRSVRAADCPHHEDERKCCRKCCDGEIGVHSYPLVNCGQ